MAKFLFVYYGGKMAAKPQGSRKVEQRVDGLVQGFGQVGCGSRRAHHARQGRQFHWTKAGVIGEPVTATWSSMPPTWTPPPDGQGHPRHGGWAASRCLSDDGHDDGQEVRSNPFGAKGLSARADSPLRFQQPETRYRSTCGTPGMRRMRMASTSGCACSRSTRR